MTPDWLLEDELEETLRLYSKAKPKLPHPLPPAARKQVEYPKRKKTQSCVICGQPSRNRYCGCLPESHLRYLDMIDGR